MTGGGGEIRRITVVGAGQMGAGIAQVAAVAGFDVILTDVAAGQLERAMMVIQGSLTKLSEKGRIDQVDAESAVLRIRTSAEIGDADLLIEAATENIDLKLQIFREMDAAASPGAKPRRAPNRGRSTTCTSRSCK
jgi:3-hydroxybutyryl-CoA dehydrogenase